MPLKKTSNGFLSGKYNKHTKYKEGDFRENMRRFSPEVIEHNQAVLDLLKEIAERKNATRAQIILAWELAQKEYIVPIPGTTKIHRLEENLGGAAIELTKEELMDINEALSKIDIYESYF